MTADWSFSFAFSDDVDDSGDENDASESANASLVENQTLVFMSEETRLARDLDLSTREDPAVFKKNPWSLAKLNAASRSGATRPKQTQDSSSARPTVSTNKSQPPNPLQVSLKNQVTGLDLTANPRSSPIPPVETKQPITISNRQANGSIYKKRKETSTVGSKPIVSTQLQLHGQAPSTTETKGTSLSFSNHLRFSSPTSGPLPPRKVDEKPDFHDLNLPTALSPLKRKHDSSPEYKSISPVNLPKKRSAQVASSPIPARQNKTQPYNSKPIVQPQMPPISKVSAYSREEFTSPKDEDWSTLPVKSKNRSKTPTNKLCITGTFKLPNIVTGKLPYGHNSKPTTHRKTLLTIYQPPPPKSKSNLSSLSSSKNKSANRMFPDRDSAYSDDIGLDSSGFMDENSGSSGGSDDLK